MSNAIITKPNGLKFSIPSGSVLAILSNAMAEEKSGDDGEVGSFVLSSISGITSHRCGMSGDEVMNAIEDASAKRKGMLRLVGKHPMLARFEVSGDGCYINVKQVEGYEEISDDKLNIFWRHDPGLPCTIVTVSNTDDNRKLIDQKKDD